MRDKKNKTKQTFFDNLAELAVRKEFVNIWLVNGIKLSGTVIFANSDIVIISNNHKGRTSINPVTIATFQEIKGCNGLVDDYGPNFNC